MTTEGYHPTLGYDGYESVILASMLHDEGFLAAAIDLVRPEHFARQPAQFVAETAYEFWERYRVPLRQLASTEIERRIESLNVEGPQAQTIREMLSRIRFDPTAVPAAAAELVRYARHNALRIALEEIIPRHASGAYTAADLDEMLETMTTATRLGAHMDRRPESLPDGVSVRTARRVAGLNERRIPLLIPPLDEIMPGLKRGDLGTVMAPSGIGKTWMLAHASMSALWQGLHVLDVRLEGLREDIEDRFDMMISGLTLADLATSERTISERYEFFRTRGGELLLECSTDGLSVSALEDLLDSVAAESGRPVDMLVVDYADLLILDGSRYTSEYDRQGEIWARLKRLAESRRVAVWTATQTSRAGVGAADASEHQVADSYKKFHRADVWIALQRNRVYDPNKRKFVAADDDFPDDRAYRVSVLKGRGFVDKRKCVFVADLNRGVLYSPKETRDVVHGHANGAVADPDDRRRIRHRSAD